MEEILRGEEVYKINNDELESYIKKAYSLENKVVFFPVRHHSVGCSYHLLKVINEYNPQAILIEGPDNTNHLLENLIHEENKTPLCIYYSYFDKKKLLSDEGNKYTCYYPMLSYSPEYIAIKEAKKRNIHASFIDLSYEKTLIASKEGKGLRVNNKKSTYNNDDYMLHSTYNKLLFKNAKVQDFHEFWEKYFEIDAKYIDTETFIRNMLTYCYITRMNSSEVTLLEDGCIKREEYMAHNIKKAMDEYDRVLVVTGGFHTYGLLELLNEDSQKKKVESKYKKDMSEFSKAYLMAYSYEASDQLLGYKSGMPYSSFYKKIWDNITKEKNFENVVKYYIAKTSRKMKKSNLASSTDDAINALVLAKGLSDIRNKREPGVNELIEGVSTTFIKGEKNEISSEPVRILEKMMIGNKIGEINTMVDKPPLFIDFLKIAGSFKLELNNTINHTKILDLSKEKHIQMSYFFHRMSYLNCTYSFMTKGPNVAKSSNMHLKRETWTYRYSEEVIRRLIELSVHGGSVIEVAMELLKDEGKNAKADSYKTSNILLKSVVMGINKEMLKLVKEVEDAIFLDNEYINIINALKQIHFTLEILTNEEDKMTVRRLLNACYKKSVNLLDSIKDIDENSESEFLNALIDQNYISDYDMLDKNIFIDKIKSCKDSISNSILFGAVVGILYGNDEIKQEDIINNINSYIRASGEERRKLASFLRGLFTTGRDVMLFDTNMIVLLDDYIKKIDDENFIEILPELRYAFSIFMPREIDKIAKSVGSMYNETSSSILNVKGANPIEVKRGSIIDKKAKSMLMEWGIIDG